jgi:hypothetical protein
MSSSSNANKQSEKQYFITVNTEYKVLEKKFLQVRENLKKWEQRVNLAKKNGKFELQIEAEGQVEIIGKKVRYITDQLMSLKMEVEKALKSLHKFSQQQLSIDPNKLLADMNNLIGDGDSMNLEKEFNNIEVDNELERLKKEMGS